MHFRTYMRVNEDDFYNFFIHQSRKFREIEFQDDSPAVIL